MSYNLFTRNGQHSEKLRSLMRTISPNDWILINFILNIEIILNKLWIITLNFVFFMLEMSKERKKSCPGAVIKILNFPHLKLTFPRFFCNIYIFFGFTGGMLLRK
jgi:hypothetical protein